MCMHVLYRNETSYLDIGGRDGDGAIGFCFSLSRGCVFFCGTIFPPRTRNFILAIGVVVFPFFLPSLRLYSSFYSLQSYSTIIPGASLYTRTTHSFTTRDALYIPPLNSLNRDYHSPRPNPRRLTYLTSDRSTGGLIDTFATRSRLQK